jgi:DNA invertase Pin-like site-specific DNA recombinase
MMLEQQREGIAIAKLKGKYKGKPVNIELTKNILGLAEKGINKMQIAKQLDCSRTTVYKVLSN